MTAEDAADGQVEALEGTMFADSLNSILRAGGGEATRCRRERTDASLVEEDGDEQHPLQDLLKIMPEKGHGFKSSRFKSSRFKSSGSFGYAGEK